MNRFLSLMVVVLLMLVVLGCQSDIILEEDPPLEGIYTGVYSYITDYRAPTETTLQAHVVFIFDSVAYHMNLDTIFIDQHCFCAVDGEYAMTVGVRLRELDNGSNPDELAGCNACNEEMNPEGTFIRESVDAPGSATDSLVLKFQEGTTLQMLRLLKAPEPEVTE